MTHPAIERFGQMTFIREMQEAGKGGKLPCSVFGVSENARAQLIAGIYEGGCMFVVTHLDTQASLLVSQLSVLLPDVPVRRFVARDLAGTTADAVSLELQARRMEVLSLLAEESPCVIVASCDAMQMRMIPKEMWKAQRIALKTGDIMEPGDLARTLQKIGYERSDMVEGAGQFAWRGGILDVFCVGQENPYRIEFFDDEIDSLRIFDVLSQRTVEQITGCVITPVSEMHLEDGEAETAREKALRSAGTALKKAQDDQRAGLEAFRERLAHRRSDQILLAFSLKAQPVTDYLPHAAQIVLDEPSRITERLDALGKSQAQTVTSMMEHGEGLKEMAKLFVTQQEMFAYLRTARTWSMHAFDRGAGILKPKTILRIQSRNVLPVQGRMDLVLEQLQYFCTRQYSVLFFMHNEENRSDLYRRLLEAGIPQGDAPGHVLLVPAPLAAGAEYPDEKYVFISLREIMASPQRERKRRAAKIPNAQRIAEFSDLETGGLVVHDQYGIARFDGIVQMEVNGNKRDYLRLRYDGTDILYVPTDQMDRVQKYIGAEEHAPRLSRMSSNAWANTKARARASIEDMTKELAQLYAQRSLKKGYAFSKDTPWQREFEMEFPYEETRDQLVSTQEIKHDMQEPRPMDRLLLGDVGYGKTEVALRAAFKAVNDGKQVAILVPTTLLAQQHYETIRRRFEHYPVTVRMLSRFRTHTEQVQTLRELELGQVDILIGTHMMLGKNVRFADLGLLIIDEEQRFGVKHKEKIRQMKEEVDVLTLSATPIPRTLHMSMTGIRDMSVIETPPQDRTPVQTFVLEYQDSVVREAILRETSRNGQVFIVYNRVQSIDAFAERIRALVPDLRVAVGHGQMKENQLESVMQDFIDGQYDILVCTTIAENGIDIPNANTMIVCEADRFGLSQLYQLRGRVGRSTRSSYAYFTYRRDREMSETAQKRLSALAEYTQFGSGFKIALRDLQIRGAGNLLGSQQHGHLEAVGYELYCRMVQEAIQEITEGKGAAARELPDTQMDLEVDAYIPDAYIPNQVMKISAYQQIAGIRSREMYDDVLEELIDRYGDPPASVLTLLDVALTKEAARQCGATRVVQRDRTAEIWLAPDAPVSAPRLLLAVSESGGRVLFTQGKYPVLRMHVEKDLFRELRDLLEKIRPQSDAAQGQTNGASGKDDV